MIIIFTQDGLNPNVYDLERVFQNHFVNTTANVRHISSLQLLMRIRLGVKNRELDFKDIVIKIQNKNSEWTETKLCEKGLVSNPYFWDAGDGILNTNLELSMNLV